MKEVAVSALDSEESIIGADSGEIINSLQSVFDPSTQAPQSQ
jgi:hypothetical protein